nr:peptidyl-prolyl cis-trans isomerase B, PPIB, putative [Tanacetum cinerariifolium]
AQMMQKPTHDPIKNEADNGLHNVRGTIAMARTSDVNSATSQFFINVKDNDMLDHGVRDFGYAVFGKVVKDQGTFFGPAKRRARSSVGVIANALSSFRKTDRHLPRGAYRRAAESGDGVLRLLPASSLAQLRRAARGRSDWRADRGVAVQLLEPHHRPGARHTEPQLLQ